MKRITTLLFGLVVLAGMSFAQPVNGNFGVDQKFKLAKGDLYQKMVGADNTGFYVLKTDYEGEVWLEFWNSDNLTQESSNRIIFPTVSGVKADFEEMFYLDGKLIMFTTVTNESIKQKTLYMQEIDRSGKIVGESKPIGRLKNQNIVVDFEIELTENKQNIFVHYYRRFQKYNEEPFFFKIYNSDMEEIMNKKIKLPLVDREFDITQYIVTKDGSQILMLAKLELTDERAIRRNKGRKVYNYSVLSYDIELSRVKEYPVSVLKFIPQNAIMGYNNKEKHVDVMGFMSKKGKSEISGIYHERLDLKTKEWAVVDKKTTYYTIPRDKIRDFRAEHLMTERNELYNYQLRDLVYLSTGEPVFIAEHYNEYVDSIINPQTKEITYNNYYRYNDVIIAKVDRNNKFEWMSRLPKSQYSYNDFGDFSSFKVVVVGEKLKLLYNGNHKNIKMLQNDNYQGQVAEAKSPSRSGRAMAATIFSDGKVFSSYMFDGAHKKQIIKPGMITETQGSYFAFTKKGSSIKFAKFFVE